MHDTESRNMKHLSIAAITLFTSFSANSFDRYCVGDAHVLEMLAIEQQDTVAAEKYRAVKNKKIKEHGLDGAKTSGILMTEMLLASDMRKKEGVNTQELKARYEKMYARYCE
jgi:hypothetical protein